ncbi:hypothetical protein [Halioxenophilus aromaticivorans]|uniref:hypothetical protein n=1 Tax=Halioxenophilus aromaticivorans TaxID=1306992 RepID=UPI0031ECEA40
MSITNAQAELIWHWQDPFSPQEKTRLKHWVSKTAAAVEQTVAPYPFDVHVYFHRMAGKGEPVPWANTRRRPNQAIHFHVDPSYSLQQFLKDWTAPHELSHLLIPYVGQDYSWFAEGFASYLQYRVMHTLGVLTPEQVSQKTHAKISQAQDNYIYHKIPFHYAAQILRESKQYPVYYWGGAAFFQSLDARLQREQSSLVAVLKDYLACCRLQAKNLSNLVATLDRLAPAQVFAPALQAATTEAGFPLWE